MKNFILGLMVSSIISASPLTTNNFYNERGLLDSMIEIAQEITIELDNLTSQVDQICNEVNFENF